MAATVAAGVLVAAPAALAQVDSGWEGSQFDAPFTDGSATMTVPTFPISGVFVHAESPITGVDVEFGRGTADSFDTAAGDECVPADVGSVSDTASTDPEHADTDPTTYEFDIPEDTVTWPCNGRFAIRATARSFAAPTASSPDPRTDEPMVATVTVAVPPLPVTAVDAVVDDKANTITVTWAPLSDEELAPDAIGYRVERAGPKRGGAFGTYAPVGPSFSVDDDPLFIDQIAVPGDYRYRVRALRNGADGPVPSPVEGSDVADASMAPDPTTTTAPPTTAAAPALPDLGSGGGRPRATTDTPRLQPTHHGGHGLLGHPRLRQPTQPRHHHRHLGRRAGQRGRRPVDHPHRGQLGRGSDRPGGRRLGPARLGRAPRLHQPLGQTVLSRAVLSRAVLSRAGLHRRLRHWPGRRVRPRR